MPEVGPGREADGFRDFRATEIRASGFRSRSHGARRGLRVELVRVVEHRRFRRARGGTVMVGSDGVQQLGENRRVDLACPLLDQPQPEMDMPEEAPFIGLAKSGTTSKLSNAADIVHERRAEQEIGPEPGMELRGLTAERRDADRVLEETTCVAVMSVGAGCRKRSHPRADVGIPHERADDRGKPRMGDLVGEELEEAVELVRIATERGGELGRIGVVHRLDGPYLHLQPPTESLDASEDAHRVTLAESLVEQLDVAPDSRLDATARVRELERQIRRARLGAPPLLLGDREHPLYGPVLGELGDRGHVRSL